MSSLPRAARRAAGRWRTRWHGPTVRRSSLGRHDRLLSVSLDVFPVDRFGFASRWRLEDPATPQPDDPAD